MEKLVIGIDFSKETMNYCRSSLDASTGRSLIRAALKDYPPLWE